MQRRNQHGVYWIFTSMEIGNTFSSKMPQFPTDDPDYRIIRRVPSRCLHYYFYIFYIRDPVIAPLAMCVGTYLPFRTTYYWPWGEHKMVTWSVTLSQVLYLQCRISFPKTAPMANPLVGWNVSQTCSFRPGRWHCLSPDKHAITDTLVVRA
jgi:hypothetical protein